MSLADGAFRLLAALLHSRAGLALGREKAYLLDSRLIPVARRHGLADVDELAAAVTTGNDSLAIEVVEAMLNNETLFFRDAVPFDMLQTTVLPALRTARRASRRLRIWCAAGSTGQEPYSLAMMIDSDPAWSGWKVEIVATDLSTRALSRAESGLYSQFEVQRGLPIHLLLRYFEQEAEGWRLCERIRNMVRFEQLNLCRSFAHLGLFDIVLCRNVLMYFDVTTKAQVLAQLRRQMLPDATLVLGAAETVLGMSTEFEPDWANRGLYRVARSAASDERIAALQ